MKAQRLVIFLLLAVVISAACERPQVKTWTYGQPVTAKDIILRSVGTAKWSIDGSSDDGCAADSSSGSSATTGSSTSYSSSSTSSQSYSSSGNAVKTGYPSSWDSLIGGSQGSQSYQTWTDVPRAVNLVINAGSKDSGAQSSGSTTQTTQSYQTWTDVPKAVNVVINNGASTSGSTSGSSSGSQSSWDNSNTNIQGSQTTQYWVNTQQNLPPTATSTSTTWNGGSITVDVTPVTTTTTSTVSTWGAPDNYGCAEWRDGVCIRCSYRYIARSRTCEPVNPLCATWDNTGKCLTCYKGYAVCAEGCAPNAVLGGPQFNAPLCNAYDANGKCIKCAANAYWKNGVCTQVNPNCKTFDNNNGWCTTCYAGYSLQSGNCVLIPITPDTGAPGDLLCAVWNGNVCTKCSVNAWFNNGVCTQVNPLCKTFDSTNGACLTCYQGYAVSYGNCALVQVGPDNTAPSDLLCAKWNGNICVQCSTTAFFRNGVCVQSDPQCKTFHQVYGSCLSCYNGYYLDAGQCLKVVEGPSAPPSDLLCAKWNGRICLACSKGAFFRNGICTNADPLCKTFDPNSGACTSCYQGYILGAGTCVRAPDAPDAGPSDPFCAKWNGNICTQCAFGCFWRNGVCTPADPACKTFDPSNGACTSCYQGYVARYGQCVRDTSGPTDLLCAKWNGNICQQCSQSAFWSNGVCVQSDPLCKTFNSNNGWCTSCYSGYVLNNGQCVRAADVPSTGPSDLLCAKWNGNVCQQCSKGAYWSNGVCAQADTLCKTFDTNNGWCLSCYSGYYLTGGKCVRSVDSPDNAPPGDLLCAQWINGICQRCAVTAYWKNGVCTQADTLCKTFDSNNGACTSCYKGYALQYGQCVRIADSPADALCAKWNDGICIQCSKTAYFRNGACIQSNPQCRTFDSSNGWCTACYNGYVLSGGNCVVAPTPSQPPANIDIYCKTYFAGICKDCFFGFKLVNGACVENFVEDCRAHGCI